MVIVRENTEDLVCQILLFSVLSYVDSYWGHVQYIKDETMTLGPKGKEARAIRLITERASRRIGQMAFETALTRGATVGAFHTIGTNLELTVVAINIEATSHDCTQIECPVCL